MLNPFNVYHCMKISCILFCETYWRDLELHFLPFLSRTTPLSTADDRGQLVRRNSIGRESMRTPATGSRSPVAPLEDKQLSASWSGSELVDLWHVAKKPTDLEPIGTPIPENGEHYYYSLIYAHNLLRNTKK